MPLKVYLAFCPGRAIVTVIGFVASTVTEPLASVLRTALKVAAVKPLGSKSSRYVPVLAKLVGSKSQLPLAVNEQLAKDVPSAFSA